MTASSIVGMVDDLGRPATIYTPPEVLRRDPNRWPTPEEFVSECGRYTDAQRLELAERILTDAQDIGGLRRAVQGVRAIHQPIDAMNYRGGTPRPAQVCTGCGTDDGNWQTWPCPTVRALGPTPPVEAASPATTPTRAPQACAGWVIEGQPSGMLCDPDGWVRSGFWHHGTDYPCTGSAHAGSREIRCANPVHDVELPSR